MNMHLPEVAVAVAPGAHAVMLVDQAGWKMSNRLEVLLKITLLSLPPKCPELNPVENRLAVHPRQLYVQQESFVPTRTSSITIAAPGTSSSSNSGASCHSACAI